MSKKWTEEHDKFLREHWKDMSLQQLSKELGVSTSTVAKYSMELSRELNCSKPYVSKAGLKNEEEINFIIDNFKKLTLPEIADALGCTLGQITYTTKILRAEGKLKNHLYSDKEIEFIIDNTGKLTDAQIGDVIGRSPYSIRSIRAELRRDGQLKNRNHIVWTEQEDEFLRTHLNDLTRSEMARQLDRSKDSVKFRLRKLGLVKKGSRCPYTEGEDKFLIDNYGVLSIEEIRNQLGKTESGIRTHIWKLRKEGIKIGSPSRAENLWTDEETEFLKNNYTQLTYVQIAEILGKSRNEVVYRANQLKLHKRCRADGYTDNEIKFIIDNYRILPTVDIAEHLKRRESSVNTVISKLKKQGKILDEFPDLPKDDVDFIRANMEYLTPKEIADVLGRHAGNVRRHVWKLRGERNERKMD